MLELRLLRYFVAVAETEHVGRAAARLGVSQSPLSRQIHQLEELLGGAKLFARTGRRIALTAHGKALLPAARDLLGRSDAFVRDARTAADTDAPERLSIGFVGSALATGVLPRAIRALRSKHSRLELVMRHATTPAQLAALRGGEIDIAIVHAHAKARDLRARRLLEQPYRLAISRDDTLARGALSVETLGARPWILVGGDRVREGFLAACAAAGFSPRIAVEVVDFTSALALVEAGAGIAPIPQNAAPHPEGVILRAAPWLTIASELWAVWPMHARPLATRLVELLGA
ncbi:MAG TPA: LysR substrate-binding domain-containing protein [Kofleriaceae bacterium]|jgi:DNA-binding transcriptional LysR family regulator